MASTTTTSYPNRLRELRDETGISRERMAIDFDVRVGAIQYWEKVGIPRTRLVEVARYFDVSIDWLLSQEAA